MKKLDQRVSSEQQLHESSKEPVVLMILFAVDPGERQIVQDRVSERCRFQPAAVRICISTIASGERNSGRKAV